MTSPKCSASSLSVGAVINSTVGVAVSAATGESWAQKPQAMCSDLVKLHWTLQGRLLFFLQDTTSSVNPPSCRVLQRPDKSAVPKNRISLLGSLPCCAPPDVTFSCPFHNIIALHAALIDQHLSTLCVELSQCHSSWCASSGHLRTLRSML